MEIVEQKTIDALKWLINIFEKHGIDYQISGGFAAKLYGSERALNDIDFDISEKHFPLILQEILEYITFGPARFKNGKWDSELITLNYHGQNIDIGGYETARMSNKERTKWILSNDGGLSESTIIKFADLELKVLNPIDLVEYKKELDGKHQLQDIEAVLRYIEKNP